MLFGEHAAVYGYPCIVTAVSERLSVSIEETDNHSVVIDAPHVKNTSFVEQAVANVYEEFHLGKKGLHIRTFSMFSNKYGFGSSSAVTVATVFALFHILEKPIDLKYIFDIAYKTVLDVQKVSSGFDVAAAVYGGTLYFNQFGKVIEPLSIQKGASFLVGYSGVKGDTVTLVQEVAKKKDREPEKVGRIFSAISELVEKAKLDILEEDWETVGKWMNFNQEYLRDLGVSTEKLESMISVSKKAGAYGAKLSGAGGGDCMIALVPNENRAAIADAITEVGGQVIDVSLNAEGVRIEPIT